MTSDRQTQADDEAARWFVLLRDEDVTTQDREDFDSWLSASPANRQAWQQLERIWGTLDLIERPALPGIRRYVSFGVSPLAAAAVLLLAVFAGWQLLPSHLMADYRTGTGERRVVHLADGSRVELGALSAIDVDLSGDRRSVALLEGEAFFEVAADATHPFVVSAGAGEIKVLGTAFNVKLGEKTNVAVTQHTVEVRTGREASVRVNEGEAVSYGAGGISAVAPADLAAVQAWRHDELVFEDAPLGEVLAELERYRGGNIQLVGSGAADRKVTAVFDARRADAAFDTIAESLGLTVIDLGAFTVAFAP